VRPSLRFLSEELITRILSEAADLLQTLGIELQNEEARGLLCDHGATIDPVSQRVLIGESLVKQALAAAPREVRLYNTLGELTHELGGERVYFTPGSSAIMLLDADSKEARPPLTRDYVRYARLVSTLEQIAAQSTAFICQDVPGPVQDAYRLYLSLLLCEKPVVTGAFTIESFDLMHRLQVAIRSTEEAVREKPLAIFSCCPTAPLKWSRVTSQNLLDCARSGVPVEYISMPLLGFMGPVTLVGSLVQHTAETLSGLVMSQLARPGCPVLYGGSPAAFDIRFETTPMGAAETQMIDCAYCEIGKHLGLPTQAYIGLSDAKALDAQAGLETSMGATLAVLAGINSVSGPGMLDFESCISLEKLVVDNEICGLALRLGRGIEPREDFPARPRFEEMLAEGHLLISKHTRKHLRAEHHFPGPLIERANYSRWRAEGASTLGSRARSEIERRLAAYTPPRIPDAVGRELTAMMSAAARRHGLDRLPAIEPEG